MNKERSAKQCLAAPTSAHVLCMMYESFVTFVDKMMAALEFENCRLDLKRRQFYRNGELTALEPRCYDGLSYLVAHRDRIVSKDELINEVWKTIVSDTALTRCVMKLRKAVGDDPKNPSITRTVQRSGDHFIADVSDGNTEYGSPQG